MSISSRFLLLSLLLLTSASCSDDGAGSGSIGQGTGGGSGSVGSGGNSSASGGASGNAGSVSGSGGNGGSSAAPNGGTAGVGATGGTAGVSATGGTSGADPGNWGNQTCTTWPTPTGTEEVGDTIDVSDSFDGQMRRYVGEGSLGGGSQDEGQPAMFELDSGAVLRNVIIGAPAADGVHCRGSCTLENVWWEDVGEDGATLEGSSSSQVMTIDCGGAKGAADKIVQHNGPGTVIIRNFTASNFNKLYRSCGNCDDQYERHVVLENVSALDGSVLVGVNVNYDDSATFTNVAITPGIRICERYTGNSSGDEPDLLGFGPDDTYCLYVPTDIHAL
jgi:hypothetical protein